ncbi:UNVERIFIED_CONTAM: ALA-interacting subunit [Sesamum calycinum]|uniref:ALA-interacting subunit n=1 Tax=Sesamum calycinum TaxID=2727403 RepID=A0AAW2Q639_9LAMI
MNSSTPSSSAGGPGSAESTGPRRNSKRPKYSRFTQQELPACKPILTPKWVISTFLLVSVVFIPIGVVSLFASRDVVEIVDRYENECIPINSRNDKVGFIQSSQDKTCNRTLTFHIGTYSGFIIFISTAILNNKVHSYGSGGAKEYHIMLLSEQEDLIVWMRTAALPTFRKLYGKIEVDLQAGDVINVTLQNRYNTYSFNGKKKLVLSTTSWLGGKNDFVGIAYLTVGGLCFFLAMATWRSHLFVMEPESRGSLKLAYESAVHVDIAQALTPLEWIQACSPSSFLKYLCINLVHRLLEHLRLEICIFE